MVPGGEGRGDRYKLFEPKVSGTATGREVLCLGRFLFRFVCRDKLSCRFLETSRNCVS